MSRIRIGRLVLEANGMDRWEAQRLARRAAELIAERVGDLGGLESRRRVAAHVTHASGISREQLAELIAEQVRRRLS